MAASPTTTTGPQIPFASLIPSKKGPGILMRTLKRGRGERFPRKGENCLIHFEGRLENGTTKVASSRDLRQAFQFELGAKHIIEGIEVAVEHMVVGQLVEATIPSLYAYGHQGFPPRIPPRATLIFEIELLDILCDEDTTDNRKRQSTATAAVAAGEAAT